MYDNVGQYGQLDKRLARYPRTEVTTSFSTRFADLARPAVGEGSPAPPAARLRVQAAEPRVRLSPDCCAAHSFQLSMSLLLAGLYLRTSCL
jgi:hypothetical protein